MIDDTINGHFNYFRYFRLQATYFRVFFVNNLTIVKIPFAWRAIGKLINIFRKFFETVCD
jgi:hypothetical protein